MKNNNKTKLVNGYIALSSVLVVGAILITIIMSSTLLTISSNQISLSYKQKDNTINQVESCIEDALLYLNNNNSLPTTITMPTGSCAITLNNQVDNIFTFTVSTNLNNYQKIIKVQAQRSTKVIVLSWVEQ